MVLLSLDAQAVWGWWHPHPDSGIVAMNGRAGWTCTIFRNESFARSSELILAAEQMLYASGHSIGPDGLLTYIWDARIHSVNPGYGLKCAGWKAIGRSADDRKTLLQKLPVAPLDEHERGDAMTHTRERVDPREYDEASDQGSVDRELCAHDPPVISMANWRMQQTPPWYQTGWNVVGVAIIIAALVLGTAELWWPWVKGWR